MITLNVESSAILQSQSRFAAIRCYVLELVQFLYDVLDAQMAVPFVIEAEGLVLVILKLHL